MKKIEPGIVVDVVNIVRGENVPCAKKYYGTQQTVEFYAGENPYGHGWYLEGIYDIDRFLCRIGFQERDLIPVPGDSESDWLDAALSTPAYDPAADREYKSNPLDVPAPKEAEKA